MYKLMLTLERKNDWKCALSKTFSCAEFRILHCSRPSGRNSLTILHAPSADPLEVLKFLKVYVNSVHMLDHSGEGSYFEIVTSSPYLEQDVFGEQRCFLLENPTLRKGKVFYTFGAQKRESLTALFSSLSAYGTLSMLSLTQGGFSTLNLSEQQNRVLHLAYQEGYYDFPRKITAEEIAQKIGISSPTLNEHIRRAEKKLVEYVLGSLTRYKTPK